MFSFFRRKRDPDFEPGWEAILKENVWHYRHLDARQRERVQTVVARLVARKEWFGGGGLEITDEVRVTISGVAALLTLGLDEPYDFPRLKSLIIYPAGFAASPETQESTLLGSTDPLFGGDPRLGEAWPRSPIILSWRAASRQARVRGRGRNLVLHEFAHHIDGLSGAVDGVPHFDNPEKLREWHAVADEEYSRLVGQAWNRTPSLLDKYGATNDAEFFAVVTECFFERPHAFRSQHRELYDLMTLVFHHDPTEWVPASESLRQGQSNGREASEHNPTNNQPRELHSELSHLDLSDADERFTRAGLLIDRNEIAKAEQLLTEVLAEHPEDVETLTLRAVVRLYQDNDAGAMQDASAALAIDPEEVEAMLVLADANLGCGDDSTAEHHLRKAAPYEDFSSWAHVLQGRLSYRRGEVAAAVDHFRHAIRDNSFNAEAHYLLAVALEGQGDSHRAERHRSKSLALLPELREKPARM